MSTPQGYNPVGQHAPGLPRHDAPLPGHVPGQYTNIGGGGEEWPSMVRTGDPGFGPGFGIWSGRIIMFATMYFTVPVQIVLYPIAGAMALVTGGGTYLLLSLMGMERDSVLSWVWTSAFLGLAAAMRTETGYEVSRPAYRDQRHLARLGLIFVGMLYLAIHEQHESVGMAILLGAVVAAISHFIFKAKLLRQIWDGMQTLAWLRKE